MSKDLLIKGDFLLEKFPGKGGWTYAALPGVVQDKEQPFGWVKVKGSIDDYQLNQYKLMPMGEGRLFLPVKASLRKFIQKESGDYVKVILYRDRSSLEIPEEIEACFRQEDANIRKVFMKFSEGERKRYLDWIYGSKREETKAQRILTMMEMLSRGLKYHEGDKMRNA